MKDNIESGSKEHKKILQDGINVLMKDKRNKRKASSYLNKYIEIIAKEMEKHDTV